MAINLADPDKEPTDEELAALMREAFSGVAAANERALAGIRDQIAIERKRAIEARARSSDR
jgi:hypothetical protein